MENLIFKYLNNELNQKEWKELQDWLDESPQNRLTLNKLQSYRANATEEATVMREVIWEDLRARIGIKEAEKSIGRSNQYHLFFYKYMKVAAVALIVATLSFVLYQTKKESHATLSAITMVEKIAPVGRKMSTKLPDGSTVVLNAGSKISYPDSFDGNVREIELSGEAFFNVRHNPKKPFHVIFSGDVVKVLGTSFNIRAYEEDGSVSVAVATGKVSYTISGMESEMVLAPDEMATYDIRLKQLTKQKVDRLEMFGWKDKILYFKNKPFDQIVIELERWYGVKIEVKKDFTRKGTFSGQFRDKPLTEVLTGLSYLYEFDFNINENTVILN